MGSMAPRFLAGDVVYAPIFPWLHEGIIVVCCDGTMSVISASHCKGRVIEETMEGFSNGNPVRLKGYYGTDPRRIVVHRARSALGVPYSALGLNCEHFTRWAHGVRPKSPQLRGSACLLSGLVAMATMAVIRSTR